MIIVNSLGDAWSCRKCGPHSLVMTDISTKFGWCPNCEEDFEFDEVDHVDGMMYDLKFSAGGWIHTRVIS